MAAVGGTDKHLFSDIMSMKEYGFRDSTYATRHLKVLENSLEGGNAQVRNADMPLVLHVILKKITKLAGIQTECLLVYRDTIPVFWVSVPISDGRWNNFSTLLAENSEKLVKSLRMKLRRMAFNKDFYPKEVEWLIRKSK